MKNRRRLSDNSIGAGSLHPNKEFSSFLVYGCGLAFAPFPSPSSLETTPGFRLPSSVTPGKKARGRTARTLRQHTPLPIRYISLWLGSGDNGTVGKNGTLEKPELRLSHNRTLVHFSLNHVTRMPAKNVIIIIFFNNYKKVLQLSRRDFSFLQSVPFCPKGFFYIYINIC